MTVVTGTPPRNTASPGDVELGTLRGALRQALLLPPPPRPGEETEAQGHTATAGCVLNAQPGRGPQRPRSLPQGTELGRSSTKTPAPAPVRKPSALDRAAPSPGQVPPPFMACTWGHTSPPADGVSRGPASPPRVPGEGLRRAGSPSTGPRPPTQPEIHTPVSSPTAAGPLRTDKGSFASRGGCLPSDRDKALTPTVHQLLPRTRTPPTSHCSPTGAAPCPL